MMQNAQGEILVIHNTQAADYSHYSAATLCKSPNMPWQNCSGHLSQVDHQYYSIALDETDSWVLIAAHADIYGMSEAILTARDTGNGWDILTQPKTK